MPTMVSGGSAKEFTPAPVGTHQAVCVDVIDLGFLETQWGKKRKVTLRWQLAELMDNGKPFLVQKRYTASLHEKAVLRHDLEAWRGRPFTEAELAEFDLDNLMGVNCLVSVIHRKGSDGKTWANVSSVSPLMKGMAKIAAKDYIRERDKQDATEHGGESDPGDYVPDDDPTPF